MRAKDLFRRVTRMQAGGIAGLILVAAVSPPLAEDRSSPMPVLLGQQARTPATQHAPRPRGVATPVPNDRTRAQAAQVAAPGRPGFVIAVFGDAFAYSIARGLDDSHDGKAVGIFDATSESNGLTQDSVADWATAIGAVVADQGHIDAAAMMLGGADLRPLTTDAGLHLDFGTPAWRAAYGDRVQRLAEAFRDRHIPLVWVGLPVVRDDDQASRFADLNAITRERARAGGATYIDSWEAFVDDNGQYDASGPDVNGQTAKLRHNDGVGFTRAGADKLASFVDVELRPIEDRAESSRRIASVAAAADDQDVFDQALRIDVNAQIRREAGIETVPAGGPPSGPKAGPIMLLTAVPVSSGGQLAMPGDPHRATDLVDAALVRGITPRPEQGRTDDFSWPKR